MKATKEDIQALLHKYHSFQECILLSIKFDETLLNLTLTFNYVWDGQGHIRSNLDKEFPIAVTFHQVHDFHFRNHLTPGVLSHLNWSQQEIALVNYMGEQTSTVAAEAPHLFRVEWEDDSRGMEIVCLEVTVGAVN